MHRGDHDIAPPLSAVYHAPAETQGATPAYERATACVAPRGRAPCPKAHRVDPSPRPDPAPGRAFDVTAEKVFESVLERIQARDLERGRARFEIETDQGQTIRVRLTVDHNVVSVRIDAPTEQVRDLLAGHAWELNQRLETEGLIPEDIEFCLTGGRDQTSGQDGRAGVRNDFASSTSDDEFENFTMVETEAYAFESWA